MKTKASQNPLVWAYAKAKAGLRRLAGRKSKEPLRHAQAPTPRTSPSSTSEYLSNELSMKTMEKSFMQERPRASLNAACFLALDNPQSDKWEDLAPKVGVITSIAGGGRRNKGTKEANTNRSVPCTLPGTHEAHGFGDKSTERKSNSWTQCPHENAARAARTVRETRNVRFLQSNAYGIPFQVTLNPVCSPFPDPAGFTQIPEHAMRSSALSLANNDMSWESSSIHLPAQPRPSKQFIFPNSPPKPSS